MLVQLTTELKHVLFKICLLLQHAADPCSVVCSCPNSFPSDSPQAQVVKGNVSLFKPRSLVVLEVFNVLYHLKQEEENPFRIGNEATL